MNGIQEEYIGFQSWDLEYPLNIKVRISVSFHPNMKV